MTYEGLINTLRTYATETAGDCPEDCPVKRRQEATCREVFSTAASALENLVELARENEKREDEAEEHTEGLKHLLACKQTENNILRSELRRMFQLYVAAETRADTGVSEGVDDA